MANDKYAIFTTKRCIKGRQRHIQPYGTVLLRFYNGDDIE